MALQTSGAISLNDIHVEAGGTTGTTCSLNDTDIRDLISKTSGAQMSVNEWYGASARTHNLYTHGGSYFSDTAVDYSWVLYQKARSATDETSGIGIVGDQGFSFVYGGVMTDANWDALCYDTESGLATELNKWNKVKVEWGNNGVYEHTGRNYWGDYTVGGVYDVTILTGSSPSIRYDTSGTSLADWIASGYSFTVRFDERI